MKSLAGFSENRKKTAYAIDIAEGAGETHFYAALKYALSELDKEGKRRKAIVVLTDGLDTQLRKTDRDTVAKAQTDQEALAAIKPQASAELNSVLAAADRQGVTIYPLALPSGDPKRLPIPGPDITGIYSAARTRLETLAERTGGRLNEINRLENIAVRQAALTEGWQEKGQDFVTVYFLASLVDYTTDESGAQVLDGSRTEPVKFEEYWTFARPVGPNPWKLSAIQQPA